MAQDFQDLTGQVIRKVVDMVQGLEAQLLQVLIEAMPAERKAEVSDRADERSGDQRRRATGRGDIQAQVDELLESLGF